MLPQNIVALVREQAGMLEEKSTLISQLQEKTEVSLYVLPS